MYSIYLNFCPECYGDSLQQAYLVNISYLIKHAILNLYRAISRDEMNTILNINLLRQQGCIQINKEKIRPFTHLKFINADSIA